MVLRTGEELPALALVLNPEPTGRSHSKLNSELAGGNFGLGLGYNNSWHQRVCVTLSLGGGAVGKGQMKAGQTEETSTSTLGTGCRNGAYQTLHPHLTAC